MATKSNQTHIIAGKWRSRKLNFPDLPTLRPTPNRVRETLFNWLSNNIVGAYCLDCFAGSGALGFEALSRGAAWVTMIDNSKNVVENLKVNAALLGAKTIDFHCAKFPFLEPRFAENPFDIVFLDPPYHQGLIAICCEFLEKNHYLKEGALIYIEAERKLTSLPIPENWHILKSQKAGQVGYHLILREAKLSKSHESA